MNFSKFQTHFDTHKWYRIDTWFCK